MPYKIGSKKTNGHKGGRQEDVAKNVEIAVSALTVNVNRQMDGYTFIPLH